MYKYKLKNYRFRNFFRIYYLKFPSRIEKHIASKMYFSFPDRYCFKYDMQLRLHTDKSILNAKIFAHWILELLLAHITRASPYRYPIFAHQQKNYNIISDKLEKVYNTEISAQQIDNCAYIYMKIYILCNYELKWRNGDKVCFIFPFFFLPLLEPVHAMLERGFWIKSIPLNQIIEAESYL